MKKRIALFLFVGVLSICCNAQNIIQISNNGNGNSNLQQECPFRINGICSTEDIGGVAFEKKNFGYVPSKTMPGTVTEHIDYVATNYNSFPVTVLVLERYTVGGGRYAQDEENVLTIVLKSNESKEIGSHATYKNHHIQSITRRLGGK